MSSRPRAERRAGTGALVAAGAWLALTGAVDAAIATETAVGVVLFALSPLIASAVVGPGRTALAALGAVGLAGASWAWDQPTTLAQYLIRLVDVTVVRGAAVGASFVRVRREQRLHRLRAVAEAAQQAILPRVPARVGTVAVATAYVSATADAHVGGDLFDVVSVDDCVRVLIGDVRGHGLDAVQHAAGVIRAFRQHFAAPSLEALTTAVNDEVAAVLGSEDFVTATLVEIAARDAVRVVNCGHHDPLLVRPHGFEPLTAPTNLPLGLGDRFQGTTTLWPADSRLMLYTDRLVEARDAEGGFFDIASVHEAVRRSPLPRAVEAVVGGVRSHTGGVLTDDLAVVLLERAR